MNNRTYASTARDTLGALQDISAKLDRLIELLTVVRPLATSVHNSSPRRRRLAS